MNMDYTLYYVPIILMISWSSFLVLKNLMAKLLMLLLTSLVLPWLYYNSFMVFWPCALMMILMSTGLIVVFAYITSLDQSKLEVKFIELMWILILSSLFLWAYEPHESFQLSMLHVSLFGKIHKTKIYVSILLVGILVLFVILFIRLTYSKGGGFRKKF